MGEGLLTRLAAMIAGKRVVPPVPPGKSMFDEAPDDEAAVIQPEPDESASTSCYIEYVDSKGARSARVITFRRISGHFGRPETIGAHCHLRQKYKNFSIERIQSMACAESGEELDPLEHCLALQRHGALKIEDKALVRIMQVVTFMARCDGEYHGLERTAIDDVVGRYMRFFGGDDAAYECACREAMALAPSDEDVIRAVNWIGRAPMAGELARFTAKASAAVIDADGRHRQEEIDWGVELGNVLRRISDRHPA